MTMKFSVLSLLTSFNEILHSKFSAHKDNNSNIMVNCIVTGYTSVLNGFQLVS